MRPAQEVQWHAAEALGLPDQQLRGPRRKRCPKARQAGRDSSRS